LTLGNLSYYFVTAGESSKQLVVSGSGCPGMEILSRLLSRPEWRGWDHSKAYFGLGLPQKVQPISYSYHCNADFSPSCIFFSLQVRVQLPLMST